MRVKPILFNTEKVRAILDGRKTVTRQVIKGVTDKFFLGECIDGDRKDIGKVGFGAHECGGEITFVKPPYQPGDILYVRETWAQFNRTAFDYYLLYPSGGLWTAYKSDGELRYNGEERIGKLSGHEKFKWSSSIHMPKEAARIWLKVTDVRVERLRDITWEDGYREGLENPARFNDLWDSTIKKKDLPLYGWDANPWVWVIEFERREKPESEE